MDVLLIDQPAATELLPLGECIGLMERTLHALAAGRAVQPLRDIVWLADRKGALATMPGYVADVEALGAKVISAFPPEPASPYDSHQGVVLLFDARHGRLLAILDATAITAIRTAAVSAVATKALARPDARVLAILGSGTQAWSHLEAMLEVRDIERVRVWGRTPAHADAFAAQAGRRWAVPVEAVGTPKQAVTGAHIVCTTTAAREPVLEGRWLEPGTHVNAVGSAVRSARELDTEAVRRARLFVDRRDSALAEAGDFLIARAEGAVADSHIAGELGEVLIGAVPGRTRAEDVTLFESQGLAVQDLAAAHHIVQRATERGMGTRVRLGGLRHGLEPAGPAAADAP